MVPLLRSSTTRAASSLLWRVGVLAIAVTAATAGIAGPAHGAARRAAVRVVATSAPRGFETPKGQWLRITRGDGKSQLAEVFRPAGSGAHPLVVVLHGASGLAGIQLQWAAQLARKGYVVLAGCYLDAIKGSAPRSYVPCPSLPDITNATTASTRRAATALVDAAMTLKGTRPGKLGVVGMSYGADVALDADDTRVTTIVADSGYRETAGVTKQPVLLFGFTNDPNVPHAKLVAFAAAQRKAGRSIQTRYYKGTGHVALLTTSTANDSTTRTVTFMRKQIG